MLHYIPLRLKAIIACNTAGYILESSFKDTRVESNSYYINLGSDNR